MAYSVLAMREKNKVSQSFFHGNAIVKHFKKAFIK
jgi:hypothetical protein